MRMRHKDKDKVTETYWSTTYSEGRAPTYPSPFALWCLGENLISCGSEILEFGCGNGRDSFAFINRGARLLAVDSSAAAIYNNSKVLNEKFPSASAKFICCDVNEIFLAEEVSRCDADFSVVYSRFFLHAISFSAQSELLFRLTNFVTSGCIMVHEFRTTKDPLFEKGVALGEGERFTDHYRRFIEFDEIVEQVETLGWEVLLKVESNGLARLGGDDPVVGRLVAKKR